LRAVCTLWQAQAALSGSAIAWGAQNVNEHSDGAFTGEVAAGMRRVRLHVCDRRALRRRTLFGESDATVAAKAAAVIDSGLIPVVCVGETQAERAAGNTDAVVVRQLDAVLSRLGAHRQRPSSLMNRCGPSAPGWNLTPAEAQAVRTNAPEAARGGRKGHIAALRRQCEG
jgi:triosephosphate isomerase